MAVSLPTASTQYSEKIAQNRIVIAISLSTFRVHNKLPILRIIQEQNYFRHFGKLFIHAVRSKLHPNPRIQNKCGLNAT